MSSETTLQQEHPRRFRHRFRHRLMIRIKTFTSIHFRKQNQINTLPNHLHTQRDILRAIAYKPIHNPLLTATILPTIPTKPNTITFRPTSTYRAIFEVSGNFPTRLFERASQQTYGSSTSQNHSLQIDFTRPHLRTTLQT